MREIIEKSIAHGSARVPPSKSDAHRKLICAAMCAGRTGHTRYVCLSGHTGDS